MTSFANDNRSTIFVGNISEKVTEELLYELFLQAGPLKSVCIPKDHKTGGKRSFGFVVYSHEDSVNYALAIFDGVELCGRVLNLKRKHDNRSEAPKQVADIKQDEQQVASPHTLNDSRPFANDFISGHNDTMPMCMQSTPVYNGRQHQTPHRNPYHTMHMQLPHSPGMMMYEGGADMRMYHDVDRRKRGGMTGGARSNTSSPIYHGSETPPHFRNDARRMAVYNNQPMSPYSHEMMRRHHPYSSPRR